MTAIVNRMVSPSRRARWLLGPDGSSGHTATRRSGHTATRPSGHTATRPSGHTATRPSGRFA
jgi:hypothetical protein